MSGSRPRATVTFPVTIPRAAFAFALGALVGCSSSPAAWTPTAPSAASATVAVSDDTRATAGSAPSPAAPRATPMSPVPSMPPTTASGPTTGSSGLGDQPDQRPAFRSSISPIDTVLAERMATSWRPGCPVPAGGPQLCDGVVRRVRRPGVRGRTRRRGGCRGAGGHGLLAAVRAAIPDRLAAPGGRLRRLRRGVHGREQHAPRSTADRSPERQGRSASTPTARRSTSIRCRTRTSRATPFFLPPAAITSTVRRCPACCMPATQWCRRSRRSAGRGVATGTDPWTTNTSRGAAGKRG